MLYNTLHVYDKRIDAYTYEILAVSAWLVLFAMIFDMLDGFARQDLSMPQAMHGIQMDSLADMVPLSGRARPLSWPVMAHSLRVEMRPFQYLSSCLVILRNITSACAASRLAYLHTSMPCSDEKKSGEKFSGLSFSGRGAAICSLVIFYGSEEGEISQIVFDTSFLCGDTRPAYGEQHPPISCRPLATCPYAANKKGFLFSFVILYSEELLSPFLVYVQVVNIYVASGPVVLFIRKLGLFPEASTPKYSRTIKQIKLIKGGIGSCGISRQLRRSGDLSGVAPGENSATGGIYPDGHVP
jgi:phosphatidylserine synthase